MCATQKCALFTNILFVGTFSVAGISVFKLSIYSNTQYWIRIKVRPTMPFSFFNFYILTDSNERRIFAQKSKNPEPTSVHFMITLRKRIIYVTILSIQTIHISSSPY